MAECHPVGFRWVMEAKRRGATIIHVDPRFTRTSAVADIHVPIRAGTDIAFLGGHRQLHPRRTSAASSEYVVNYTNAPAIIDGRVPGHRGPGRAVQRVGRGEGAVRPPVTWQYQGRADGAGGRPARDVHRRAALRTRAASDPGRSTTTPRSTDPRLRVPDPETALSRYTPEMVEEICGIPQDLFLKVAETLCDNSRPRADLRLRLRGGLDPAHRRASSTSAPPPSSSCCWATSAGRAAASWRCAGTPRSRAPPTSRPCTTSCPATSPCPRRRTTPTFERLRREQRVRVRLVERTSRSTSSR